MRDDSMDFGRRNFLRASSLAGVAALATASAQQAGQTAANQGNTALTVKEVNARARKVLEPYCHVCKECDGVACAGEFPGLGGIDSGMSFQNNFLALKRLGLNLRTLTDVATVDRKPDTSVTIFGQKLSLPALAAPMGGMRHLGPNAPSPEQYFDAIIGGCVDAGTAGALGDEPTPADRFKIRLDVVKRYPGRTLVGIKPRPNPNFLKTLPLVEAAGPFMLTIDVDSAGRYGGQDREVQVGSKTVAQLRELVRATRLPLVVKGVMTVDEALMAGEAGAAGIVVSNHGGRVLDHTPGTAAVLPAIADAVKGKMVIFADGCVRYGADVLKYRALGADAVLVGRHLVKAACGGGREGVALFMNTMRDELQAAMALTGAADVGKISRRMLV